MTVLVPLHRSERFVDVVDGNLRRLADDCRVIVSDASCEDDALAELQRRFDDRGTITWLGCRSIEPGWIAHYNDLRERVSTPYFMWLPHDDEIDVDYIEQCRSAIGEGVIGATGVIDSIDEPGLRTVSFRRLGDVDPSTRYVAEANRLLFESNPGVAFRAVFRTDAVGPIRETNEQSEWADQVWIYGVCLDGTIVEVSEAVYRKRLYAASTHAQWRGGVHVHALPHLVREVEARGLPDRLDIVAELVERSTRRAARLIDDSRAAAKRATQAERALKSKNAGLEAERKRLASDLALLKRADTRLDEVLRSRTWRIGRAVLSPVRLARRLRRMWDQDTERRRPGSRPS